MDPQYARAYAWVAVCYNRLAKHTHRGNNEEYAKARTTSREYAEKALSLDPSDSLAMRVLGWSYIWSGRFTEGERLFERAYTMDPHLTYAAMTYVTALVYVGKPEQAITLAETTIRQDPRHSEYCLYDLAEAYFFGRRNSDAVTVLDGLTDENLRENRAVIVAAYAYADRLKQARRHALRYIDELRENWKGSPSADLAEHLKWDFQHFHPHRRLEDLTYLQEGLRKADLPA
jgi:tetratricopeptide (TPR) repeat protein